MREKRFPRLRRVKKGAAYGGAAILLKLLFTVVPRLPRGAVLGIARFLGRTTYCLGRGSRRVALANLDLAFGSSLSPAEKRATALASFQTFFRALFDCFWFSRDTRRRVERWVRVEPSIDGLRREGAALIVTAHFGNWEMMGQILALSGIPPVSVAAMFPSAVLNGLITRWRERLGMEIVPRSGALKALLRALQRGAKAGLLVDQNTRLSEGGVFVRFFGVPATISPAASLLARRTGAPVYPVFCLALPDGAYRAYAAPPLAAREGAGPEALNQAISDAFEREIRANPGQWLWMYRRWKYRPSGGDSGMFPFYAHDAAEGKEAGS